MSCAFIKEVVEEVPMERGAMAPATEEVEEEVVDMAEGMQVSGCLTFIVSVHSIKDIVILVWEPD